MTPALGTVDALGLSKAWGHVATTGAYAEGTSYYSYAADLAVPFALSHARFLSGASPFLASDAFALPALWALDLRLPDGRRPPIDNATDHHEDVMPYHLSQVRGGARRASDQAALLWDWRTAGWPGAGGRHALGVLGSFDPSPAVVAASASAPWADPSRILEREGAAVLRSGPGPDAAWALVTAERGEARTRGTGHDSADHGAFQLYLRGDLVALDLGYGGFTQVERTNAAEHRSMILVDGKGPKPAHKWLGIGGWVAAKEDARIVRGPRTLTAGPVRTVLVETGYEGASLARTVALVDERYLLAEDRCRAKKSRTFTAQVHPNAGAAKGKPLARTAADATFETHRGVPAAVGFAANAALSLATAAMFDATGDSPQGHDALRASAAGSDVTFLTAVAANAKAARSR